MAGVTGMKAPTLFTTMYMHAAPKMQCRLQCLGPGLNGVSGTLRPALSRIVQMDFGEFPFYELR
jgi:hypothetical protein